MNCFGKIHGVLLFIVLVLECYILSQCGPVYDSATDSNRIPVDGGHAHHDNISYWLYTRKMTTGELLNRSSPRMTENTKFDIKNPIKVLVHGWMGTTHEKESFCTYINEAYIKYGEYNVICMDWIRLSHNLKYKAAKRKAKSIGIELAEVLKKITNNMHEGAEKVHLIGHSLGAHIVGFTGKTLVDQIPRITGLDPARPLYENCGPDDRIDATDANFVDIMHTNTKKYGLPELLGHIDFFPNGGRSQPSCKEKDKATGGACSHSLAYHYFAGSILNKEKYSALQCSSWEEYEADKCDKFANSTYMGEFVDQNQSGSYFLILNEPFNQTISLKRPREK